MKKKHYIGRLSNEADEICRSTAQMGAKYTFKVHPWHLVEVQCMAHSTEGFTIVVHHAFTFLRGKKLTTFLFARPQFASAASSPCH